MIHPLIKLEHFDLVFTMLDFRTVQLRYHPTKKNGHWCFTFEERDEGDHISSKQKG